MIPLTTEHRERLREIRTRLMCEIALSEQLHVGFLSPPTGNMDTDKPYPARDLPAVLISKNYTPGDLIVNLEDLIFLAGIRDESHLNWEPLFTCAPELEAPLSIAVKDESMRVTDVVDMTPYLDIKDAGGNGMHFQPDHLDKHSDRLEIIPTQGSFGLSVTQVKALIPLLKNWVKYASFTPKMKTRKEKARGK